MDNEALKLEAERRAWIGETLIWARLKAGEEGPLLNQLEDWILWAQPRLNQPWTPQPTA